MQKRRKKLWNKPTRNVPKIQHEHKLKKIELLENEEKYKQFFNALLNVHVESKDFFSWVMDGIIEGNQHLVQFLVDYRANKLLTPKSSIKKKPSSRVQEKIEKKRHIYEKVVEIITDESLGTDSYLDKEDVDRIYTILEMEFDF